ncbi:MAG: COG1361 S-layer family protein [Candidatus Aenigmatarchaeota archaeon]
MKLALLPICLLFLLAPMAAAQVTVGEVITAPWIDIVLTSQTPYPVEPGENVNLEIEIQNSGTTAKDLTLEMVVKDPFMLLPGEDAEKTFASIAGGGSVKTSYNLFVQSDAITNLYEIEFRVYTADDRDTYVKDTITVNVQGSPELVLEDLQISDGVPGGDVNLTAAMSNIGTGTARHLKLNFNSTEELMPLLSKGSVYLGDLGPGQTAQAVIGVSVDSSAEQKTYTSVLTAEYLDESNTLTQETFSVGIPIKGSVTLDIIKIEPDYRLSKLKIEVANKGTTEAKSLEAKLTIDGKLVDVEYSSTLKATKKTTLSFPLILQGTGALTIDYTGPGMDKNQMTKEVTLNFAPPAVDYTGVAIVVIIILAVAVYFFRRRRHAKKK